MLVGLVILFALLAAATGYTAFTTPAAGGIGVWDGAFIGCVAVFVVLFVRLLWSKAASVVMGRGSNVGDRSESDRAARGLGGPRR